LSGISSFLSEQSKVLIGEYPDEDVFLNKLRGKKKWGWQLLAKVSHPGSRPFVFFVIFLIAESYVPQQDFNLNLSNWIFFFVGTPLN